MRIIIAAKLDIRVLGSTYWITNENFLPTLYVFVFYLREVMEQKQHTPVFASNYWKNSAMNWGSNMKFGILGNRLCLGQEIL